VRWLPGNYSTNTRIEPRPQFLPTPSSATAPHSITGKGGIGCGVDEGGL